MISIGQRLDVWEVIGDITNTGYMPIGFQSIGEKSPLMPNVDHTTMQSPTFGTYTMWPGEYKKIGTLVITKVK